MNKIPYLSVVGVSRNDSHGGNILQRTQITLNGLLEQLEEYHIESELILVDWNPPADKPLLKDIINWSDKLKYCTIRVIIVPLSIHQRYEYSERMPINVITGLNCGIRRARGQFILPSPMDLFRSEELMSYIASRELENDVRYRIDRCDVDRNVVKLDTLKEQLEYCQENIINIKTRPIQPHWWLRWLQGGLPNLHTSACGDFQLMSRHYWHLLRGYCEADIIGTYVDSLLSYASYAAGVKEVVLQAPLHLYHIDHDSKFGDRVTDAKLPLQDWLSLPFLPAWFNQIVFRLYRLFLRFTGYKFRSFERGIPTLSFTDHLKRVGDVVDGKCSYLFNDESWGLGQESLEESIISIAEWDNPYRA